MAVHRTSGGSSQSLEVAPTVKYKRSYGNWLLFCESFCGVVKMKSVLPFVVLLAFTLLPAIDVYGDEDGTRLESLAWMLGKWTQPSERGATVETWKKVSDTVFVGKGTVVANGSDAERLVESLMLTEMSGDVFYLAKVNENPLPIAFKLVESSDQLAVFENKEHDFPKRIEYRRQENGDVHVTVGDGKDRSFVIKFKKST